MSDTNSNINIIFRAIDKSVKEVLQELQTASTKASTAINSMVQNTKKHIGVGTSEKQMVGGLATQYERFAKSVEHGTAVTKAISDTMAHLGKETAGVQRVFKTYADAILNTDKKLTEFTEDTAKSGKVLTAQGSMALQDVYRRTMDFQRGLSGLQVNMQRLNETDIPHWARNIKDSAKHTKTTAMVQHLLAGNIRTVGNELIFKNSQVMKEVGFNQRAIKELGRLNEEYSSYYKLLDKAATVSQSQQKAVQLLGDSFGYSNKAVAGWGKTLVQTSAAVDTLRVKTTATDVGLGKIAGSIDKTAVAYGVLQGNIEVAGDKIRVLNDAGLQTIGRTQQEAKALGILSQNYSVYEKQLALVKNKSAANLNIFKALATNYDRNSLALTKLSDVVNKADIITGQYAASYRNLAEVSGVATTKGQKYLRQSQMMESEQNRLRVATGLLNGTYVIQNDRLQSTLKNMTDHKKAIMEVAGVYGKGSTQLKEFSRGLLTLNYRATDSTKHTRNLRNSFAETLHAVENYRKVYPELTKNLKVVDVHQEKLNRTITQTGQVFKIHSDQGLKAFQATKQQAIEMGVLSKTYDSFSSLVNKVQKVSKDHVPIIRQLADTYGYTNQNIRLLDKAWDSSLTASRREIASWEQRRDLLKATHQDYSAVDQEIKRLGSQQYINARTAENFYAAMRRSGVGVSAFSNFVQVATDKLKLTQPLQDAYSKGMMQIGLTSRSTGAHVQKLGNDFNKVFDAMLTMGARAGLSSDQLEHLMRNSQKLQEITQGLGKTYRTSKGQIEEIDRVTGHWLKTQVELDQSGRAQLRTTSRLGAAYGSYFGEVTQSSVTWTKVVNSTSRALGELNAKSAHLKGNLPQLAKSINVTDTALGVLQGDIVLTGNRMEVLNRQGLDRIGRTKEEAESLGILSKRYNTYTTELAKVSAINTKSAEVFKRMARVYGVNQESLSGVSEAVKQADKVTASLARSYIKQANAFGLTTKEGQSYLDKASAVLSVNGRLNVATQLLNENWQLQDGKLVNLSKTMKFHDGLMNQVSATYGRGSTQFKEFEKGLSALGYSATTATTENRKLGRSFLDTFNHVQRYKQAYPELAKNLDEVAIYQARVAGGLSIVNGRMQANNETGLKAIKSTREQASEMGMLSKSYSEMERLIQRVSGFSKEHGQIIRGLANQYGYTAQNSALLHKAYKDADSDVARSTASLRQQVASVSQGSAEYEKLNSKLNEFSSTQYLAQRITENYEAAINRSGIGVSNFNRVVQHVTDQLQLTKPLQQSFVTGMRSIGLESGSAAIQLKTLGRDFSRVYEAMLSMGARAGLSSQQLNQLMTNTEYLQKATAGLNKTYTIRKGVIHELDTVTNKWLKTQIAVDEQGRASIETTKRMGVNQTTAYGEAQRASVSWYETTNKAAKAVGALRAQSGALGGDMFKLAKQLDVSSIALGTMRGDIEIVGNKMKVLNESGLKLTGYTEKQAQSLGILSEKYSAYHKALSQVTKTNKENVGVFEYLAKAYNKNSTIMGNLPAIVSKLDQTTAQLAARWRQKAKVVGEDTAAGKKYLRNAEQIVTTNGKIWVATKQLNNEWDVQNGKLVNLSKAMTSHQKLMLNATGLYGQNITKFQEFERGLQSLGYSATNATDKNARLGREFLKTFDVVERYKKLYPDLAKNMDAVEYYRAADAIKRVGNEFQISTQKGVKVSKLTREQLSEMGMLSKSYHRMERVIQNVAVQGEGHEKIIRRLADTYGWTSKNATLLSKAWDNAYQSSKVRIASLQKEAAGLETTSGRYQDIQKEIRMLGSEQHLAEKTLKNYQTTLNRSGVGVSEFHTHVAKVADRLALTTPLINAYKSGLHSLGVTSQAEATRVQVVGNAFSKVYEAMYRTGLQSGLTDKQLIKLMYNSAQLRDVTNGLGKEYKIMQGQIVGIDKATGKYYRTQIDTTNAAKPMLKVTNDLVGSFGTIGKQIGAVSGALNRMYSAFRVTASYMVAGSAVYSLVMAFTAAKNAIFEFDQALKNIQAITMATAGEVKVMEQVMKKVASTTKFSATEIGAAMVYIGQAGFTAAESVQTIQAVSDLATGTLSSLTESANLLTTTLRVFHLEAAESARVADVFANAVNKSKTTVDRLNVTMNYLGPIAHSAGLSLEESAAAIMVLSNAGIRASTIGTGFRQVISRLLSPTASLRNQMHHAGMSMEDFNIQAQNAKTGGNGFVTVIRNLATVLNGDVNKAFKGFGLRGANVAIVLSTLGKDIEFFVDQASEAGTAAKMAAIQIGGLQVSAKNLRDNLGLLAISIGKILRPVIAFLIDTLKAFAIAMTTVFESKFAQWAASVALLTASLIALQKVMKLTMAVMLFKFMGESVKTLMGLETATSIATMAFQRFKDRVATAASNLAILSGEGAIAALRIKEAALQAGFLATMATAAKLAVKKLWVALLANKLLLVAAAIATVLVSLYKYKQAQIDQIADNEANAISAKQLYEDYSRYAEQLKNVKQGSSEFYRIQGRMLDQFPEMSKQLLDAQENLAGFVTWLEKMAKERGSYRAIERYEKHFKNLEKLLKNNNDLQQANLEIIRTSASFWSIYTKNMVEARDTLIGMIPGLNQLWQGLKAVATVLIFKDKAINKAAKDTAQNIKQQRDLARTLAVSAYNTDKLREQTDKIALSTDSYSKELQKIQQYGVGTIRVFEGTYRILRKMDEITKKTGQNFRDLQKGFQFLLAEFPEEESNKWLQMFGAIGDTGKFMLIEAAKDIEEYRNKLEAMNEENKYLSTELIDRLVTLEIKKRFKEWLQGHADYAKRAAELLQKPYQLQFEAAKRSYDERMALIRMELQALDKESASYATGYKNLYKQMDETISDYYQRQHRNAESYYSAQLAIYGNLPREMDEIAMEAMEEAARESLDTKKELYIEEYNEVRNHHESLFSALKTNLADQRKIHKQLAEDRVKLEKKLTDDLTKIDKEHKDNLVKLERDFQKRLRAIEQSKLDLMMEKMTDVEKMHAVRQLWEENEAKFKQALREKDLEKAQEYLSNLETLSKEAVVGVLKQERGMHAVFEVNEKDTYQLRKENLDKLQTLEKDMYQARIAEAGEANDKLKKEKQIEHDQELLELEKAANKQVGLLQSQAAAYQALMSTLKKQLTEITRQIDEINKIQIMMDLSDFNDKLAELAEQITTFNNSEVSKVIVKFLEQEGTSQSVIETIRKVEEKVVGLKSKIKELNNLPVSVDVKLNAPYGFRADGTPKGKGFLGEILAKDGKISTELSVTVNIDNKEIEIPLLVPTLTKDEIDKVVNSTEIPEAIMNKALDHAMMRMKQGLSPFLEEPITKAFDNIKEKGKQVETELKEFKKASETIQSDVTVAFVGKSGATEEGLIQLNGTLQKQLQQIAEQLNKLKGTVTSVIRIHVNAEDMAQLEKVSKMRQQLSELYTSSESGHKVNVIDLEKLEKVYELHEKLKDLKTSSEHTVKVKMDVDKDIEKLGYDIRNASWDMDSFHPIRRVSTAQPSQYYTIGANGQLQPGFGAIPETTTNIPEQKTDRELWRKNIMDRNVSDYRGKVVKDVNDYGLAFLDGMRKFVNEVPTLWEIVSTATTQTLDNMSEALFNFFRTGKFEWKDFMSTILEDVSKALMQQSIARFVKWIAGDALDVGNEIIGQSKALSTFGPSGAGTADSPAHKETTGLLTGIWNSLKTMGLGLFSGLSNLGQGIKKLGTSVLESLKEPTGILAGVGSILGGVWNVVKFGFVQIVALLTQLVSGQFIDRLFGKEGGSSATGEVVDQSEGILSGIWDSLKQVGGSLFGGLKSIWSGIKWMGNLMGGFWDKTIGLLAQLPGLGPIAGGIGKAFGWLKGLPGIGQAISWISSFFLHNGMSPGKVTVPKLHDGLKKDEFAAVLQQGERVVSKEGVHYEQQLLEDIQDEVKPITDVKKGIEDVDTSVDNLAKAVLEEQKSQGVNNQTHISKGLGGIAIAFTLISGALIAGLGGLKKAVTDTADTDTAAKSTGLSYTHNGMSPGRVGFPKLHMGLMRDEFPAILQKGERVVAKKEVHYEQKLLESINKMVQGLASEKSNKSLSVNVPVSVPALDTGQQRLTGQLQSEIERVVLRTMREYAR